jgi:hypothetical protein
MESVARHRFGRRGLKRRLRIADREANESSLVARRRRQAAALQVEPELRGRHGGRPSDYGAERVRARCTVCHREEHRDVAIQLIRSGIRSVSRWIAASARGAGLLAMTGGAERGRCDRLWSAVARHRPSAAGTARLAAPPSDRGSVGQRVEPRCAKAASSRRTPKQSSKRVRARCLHPIFPLLTRRATFRISIRAHPRNPWLDRAVRKIQPWAERLVLVWPISS